MYFGAYMFNTLQVVCQPKGERLLNKEMLTRELTTAKDNKTSPWKELACVYWPWEAIPYG